MKNWLLPVVVAFGACSKSPTPDRTAEARPAVAAIATSQGPAWARDASVDQRVEALLAKMTLEEKIGQLNQFSKGHATGPETGQKPYEELIAQGHVGSILNAAGAKDTNELQRIAVERSRLGIPLLFGVDVIHGWRTTFPIPLALAASWNPDVVQQTARVAAQEASAEGIRWTFSPMVDIARDPRWGRIIEGAGEDPFLGSLLAGAYVRGYQGDKLTDPTSIAACMKHWVGYGAAEAGRDYNSTYIPQRLLREIYLPPFKAGVDAGALTLMSAFNSLNDVPASANPRTMNILKKEWGFKGLVVSDWTSIKEVIAHGIATDGKMAARKSLLGGVDMDMESVLYLKELPALVKEGKVPMSVVDDSVRRILRVKFALGLFERPYTEDKPLSELDRKLAKRAALETFVLLKNGAAKATPVLPIAGSVRRIAVLGPLADDRNNMHGGWAGKSDEKNVVTLRAALDAYAKGKAIQIKFERGTDIMGTSEKDIAKAVAAAKQSDLVLLAVGEEGGRTGEASSRTKLDLPGVQGRLASAVLATGKPVVLIVFGRPMVLTPYVDKAAAVIQAWHPGIEAGPALADVLTGAENFSGRLPVTLPRSLGQIPIYYNALNTGRPADAADLTKLPTETKDIYVSRYIDELNAPLYPFGYGLSYTQFTYSPATATARSLSAKALAHGSGAIKVKATVTNTGSRSGTEVVQLYTRLRGTSVALPMRQLKGYQRITLDAGEAREVEFTIGREQLAFWNDDLEHVVEPAALTLWITADASSGTPLDLTITE